jgi:predicted dehydrogenase
MTTKIGVIGCGKIFGAYAGGCGGFSNIKIAACADVNRVAAEAKAKEFNIPRVCSVEELLRDPEIDIVLNLTIPAAHAQINHAALKDGKHVYTEKPFAMTPTEAKPVLAAAAKYERRVGSAPDTFLGGGIQTCRKLIDDGAIGQPVAAVAFMVGRGPEHWHPSPEFYYQRGGGPMFDMGPYYLTALVNLLGPVKRVTGATRTSFPQRTILSQPLAGKVMTVDTPTHYAGTLEFANGAIGTIVMSFDCFGGHNLPRLEVYGTDASLSVPDPNTFKGPVKLQRRDTTAWNEVPLTHSDQVGRGIGIADLAAAVAGNRPHRASGELAYHVLDVMSSFEKSSASGRRVEIQSQCERPAALPVGLKPGELD